MVRFFQINESVENNMLKSYLETVLRLEMPSYCNFRGVLGCCSRECARRFTGVDRGGIARFYLKVRKTKASCGIIQSFVALTNKIYTFYY